MASVPLDPPQLTSFVTSQMAICGFSVAMSASNVPVTVGWATIGGRKKKPGVPPSWTASLIIASGPTSLVASRWSAQLAATTTIPLSSAMRLIISPPKVWLLVVALLSRPPTRTDVVAREVACQPDHTSPVRIHHEDLDVEVACGGVSIGLERDPAVVGRPGGSGFACRRGGEPHRHPAPGGVHHKDLIVAALVGCERDLRSVGRPGRVEIVGHVIGQPSEAGPVYVYRVDLAYTAPPLSRGKCDLRPVRRPGRMLIVFQEAAAGHARDAGSVWVHHEDLGCTSTYYRDGESDLRTIRGPGRVEVA